MILEAADPLPLFNTTVLHFLSKNYKEMQHLRVLKACSETEYWSFFFILKML